MLNRQNDFGMKKKNSRLPKKINVDWDFCKRKKSESVCVYRLYSIHKNTKNKTEKKLRLFYVLYKYIVIIAVTYYLLSSTCVRIQSSLCITCERERKKNINRKKQNENMRREKKPLTINKRRNVKRIN